MEMTILENHVPNLNDEWLYYISPRFLTYRPKNKIQFSTEKYTLKTADSLSELIELFRLRHFVFLSDNQTETAIDVDKYDSECDHILIRCNKTNEICGTYRIITSNNHVGFYSESEFDLDSFLHAKGVKMELGRACIHPNHRNGHVIDLLWRGIGEYAVKINAEYLFGCSSLSLFSKTKTLQLLEYFKKNNLSATNFEVRPKEKYNYHLEEVPFCEFFSDDELKKSVPPLLMSYINAGAKVYGEPAIDQEFECLDFLTILDLNNLTSSYRKRYFKDEIGGKN